MILAFVPVPFFVLSCAIGSDANPAAKAKQWSTVYKSDNGANTSVNQHNNLPETKKLLQNDRLFPGINRTYAMRLEAETGHLWPAVDRVLMPHSVKAKKTSAAKISGTHIPIARKRMY